MKSYILKETASGLQLFFQEKPVSVSDILQIYPERRVYALHGQMGAGKTTFLRLLCSSLGVEDTVNSPTFAIVNVYTDRSDNLIYHFDCYRLKNLGEAIDLGAEEYIYSGEYCFIEWPDVIQDILPDDTVHLYFSIMEDGSRLITL